MATDSEVRAFQQKILKGCQNTQIKYGVFTSVSIAQACLESSNGTSKLSKTDNNLYIPKHARNHLDVQTGCKCKQVLILMCQRRGNWT